MLLYHDFLASDQKLTIIYITCTIVMSFFPGCFPEVSPAASLSFSSFNFQCLIIMCPDTFFFIFMLLEVLWLFDLWVNVFHEFCKIVNYDSTISSLLLSLFLPELQLNTVS